jgi:hypothetical protein
MQIVFVSDACRHTCPPQWGQLFAWMPPKSSVISLSKGGFHMQKEPSDFFKGPFNIVSAENSGCGVPLLSVAIIAISAASMLRLF